MSALWHPFTQHGLEPRMVPIARTEGACLYRPDGSAIIDAISSWWVTTHGHRYPPIMQAIREASERYDQLIFAGFTHDPAEKLANALVEMTPHGLDHVFFSDSGSTAVEVALKMALGFFRNKGISRHKIVVMEHSYHGDTIGTMSVGERGVYNAAYEPLLFGVERITFPEDGREQAALDAFEAIARKKEAAALIVEPLVLGAGGMKVYAPGLLKELARIARHHGVLLIADEVMTGWGRTGTLFACEQADVSPDILCTSKGLTGGTVPLAATLATAGIFEAHRSQSKADMLFHSSSYTANPIACAAALANVQVWRSEPVMARVAALSERQKRHMDRLGQHPKLEKARCLGTLAAVDVRASQEGYLADIGGRIREFCLERGVLVRPLGNVLYVMPPFCISEDQLGLVYGVLGDAVEALA
jgi:adenosylmethionine---8-amino-7-oxononanoate aminotransferase